jgi:S-DNA-T family DNA segregation ATPase FtsK/SpoIIIE
MKKENYVQSSPEDIARVTDSIIKILHKRAPQSGVDARTIRDRTWFEGPELYILVDNYASIMSQQGVVCPLDEIVKHLGAENRGVHLIISTNATGLMGASTMNKPLKAMMSMNAPILMLNGPLNEPPITGLKKKFAERRPGRGELVNAVESTSDIVQVAWMDPWEELSRQ